MMKLEKIVLVGQTEVMSVTGNVEFLYAGEDSAVMDGSIPSSSVAQVSYDSGAFPFVGEWYRMNFISSTGKEAYVGDEWLAISFLLRENNGRRTIEFQHRRFDNL